MLLSSIGVVAAVILFVVSKKFYVYEDPLIAEVDEILPAANCGGCGSPGCKAFAEKLVNSDDISELFCPVGGNDVMKLVSEILGKEVAEKDPTVAVFAVKVVAMFVQKLLYIKVQELVLFLQWFMVEKQIVNMDV